MVAARTDPRPGRVRTGRWRDGRDYRTLITDPGTSPFSQMPEITVPPGTLFLLGDNRDNSADSRAPAGQGGLGLVSVDRVAGRAVARTWRQGEGLDGSPL